jgi:hypothetical protein
MILETIVSHLESLGLTASVEYPDCIHVELGPKGLLVCGFINGPLGCDHVLTDPSGAPNGYIGECFQSESFFEEDPAREEAAALWIRSCALRVLNTPRTLVPLPSATR